MILKRDLFISLLECEKIASLTRRQAKSLNWHEAKKERITSSNFGSVCSLKDTTNPQNTLKNILG